MTKFRILRDSENSNKRLYVQLLWYVILGLTVAAVQFATFFVMQILTGYVYIVSSAVAFVVAVGTSYYLQRNITFAKTGAREMTQRKAFLLFLVNSGFSLLLNSIIMYTGVELLGLEPYIAQLVSMAILAMYNFIAYRFIFK